jgi:transposase
MAAAVKLRQDYDGPALRALAKRARDAGQSRRLLVLAAIYEGSSRGAAAQLGGTQRQTIRDWVVNFNAHGPAGLIDGKARGQPPRLNDTQRRALVALVEAGPTPAIHGVVRWRLKDLAQWLRDEFGVRIDETTVGRELNRMSYRRLSARPRHRGQKDGDIETFKKTSPQYWKTSARHTPQQKR